MSLRYHAVTAAWTLLCALTGVALLRIWLAWSAALSVDSLTVSFGGFGIILTIAMVALIPLWGIPK